MLKRTVVFVLSSDHSGSTWAGYVLGSHSRAAFLGEYQRAWRPEARVACTLCAAKGLPDCEVLHGAEQVAVADAFAWAAGRTGRPVLVDNSKSVAWAERFLGGPYGHAIKLIHVVKDPRNWFASKRRRIAQPVAELLPLWLQTNAEMAALLARNPSAALTVFYDELAADPVAGFKPIFKFCGLDYEAAALQYWNVPHHGFAANGASSAMLANAALGPPPAHFRTADDAFYAAHMKTLFADTRWRQLVTPAEQAEIAADRRVTDFLAGYGRALGPLGLARTGGLAGLTRRLRGLVGQAHG